MKTTHTKSYIMFLSAMMIFGTIGIFRRYIPLSSGMLAFSRGILGSAVLGICFIVGGKRSGDAFDRKTYLLLAASGVMTGINWILLFEAYNYTSVATATMCYYMEPTIIILLSPLVFREKLTMKKLACAVAAIVGMMFVSGVLENEGIQANDGIGIGFGLGAAVLYAAVVMLNKKIPEGNVYKKTIIQLMAASIVLAPYLLLTEDFSAIQMDGMAIGMVLIVGIVHTGLAYAMYYSSIRGLQAQSIAILSYLDPVLALILSSLVLQEKMSLFGVVGAVLIMGSALVSERAGAEKANKM